MSSKKPSLEILIEAHHKNEALRTTTEALKPRIEGEINSALATGDVLSEQIAVSLQTKRAQLEMIPAKLGQITARAEDLLASIQAEFNSRFLTFESELQALQAKTKKKVLDVLSPLMLDQVFVQQLVDQMVWTRTKMAIELGGLETAVRFQLSQQNIVLAARELLRVEKELTLIQTRS